jgi:hypothetical protein
LEYREYGETSIEEEEKVKMQNGNYSTTSSLEQYEVNLAVLIFHHVFEQFR